MITELKNHHGLLLKVATPGLSKPPDPPSSGDQISSFKFKALFSCSFLPALGLHCCMLSPVAEPGCSLVAVVSLWSTGLGT